MKIRVCLMLCGLWLLAGFGWSEETAQSIIQKVDDNQAFKTETFQAVMVINRGNRSLRKTFSGWGQSEGKKSFMEFTNPEDKGVKYLKVADELWIYFPDADDIMKISGHMLRQGMMGSDLSYEDLLENGKLEEKYSTQRLADQIKQARPCYVIQLDAKRPDVAYEKQVLYIDREYYVPLELELYARGGRLLKTMSQQDVKRIDGRWLPMTIVIRDLRKKNSETVMKFETLSFDQTVKEEIFTLGHLKR